MHGMIDVMSKHTPVNSPQLSYPSHWYGVGSYLTTNWEVSLVKGVFSIEVGLAKISEEGEGLKRYAPPPGLWYERSENCRSYESL